MTEDAALKQAIRRRMEQTGEKYTQARRSVLGSPSSGERVPWCYPAHWEEQCARFGQLAANEGEEVARASVYSTLHSLQLMFTLTPFRLLAGGRGPIDPDAWLARRVPVELNAEAVAASWPLATMGFGAQIERNALIVARTLDVIDEFSHGASEQAREAAAKRRATLQLLQPAPKADTVRPQTRPWGDRSKDSGYRDAHRERDHFLRSPRDQWFWIARPGIADPPLLELIDQWIADLERNYQELIDGIPAAWAAHVPLAFDAVAEGLRVEDGHGSNDRWQTELPSPARMRVHNRVAGEIGDEEAVATNMTLTPEGVSPQPDGLTVHPGESWHIRGHRLSDGTIMPVRGTYRLAAAWRR